MRKAKVTYNAPDGDNKVVEMGGVTFFDGKEVELNTDDNGAMLQKLQGNQHFDVEMGQEEESPKRRGRPPGAKTRDLKAGIEEARDHDFEADRRSAPGGSASSEPVKFAQKQDAPQKSDAAPKGDANALGFTGTSPAPKEDAEPKPQLVPETAPLSEPTKVDDKK